MRVLVVYKKSFLESHQEDRELLERIPRAQRSRVIRTDIENRQSIHDVFTFLSRKGIKFDVVYRGQLAARPLYDLIITVGGDGTFFMASHHVRRAPIFAINSDPSHSLGLFTCADRRNFEPILERALAGKLKGVRLNRLAVAINGKPIPELVVNDILYAQRNPAAVAQYRIAVDGRAHEIQRSSGVWIATAAGSTSAIRAAGGTTMPISSKRMQWRVREPFTWPTRRYRLLCGQAARAIELRVMTAEAAIWIDGSRTRHDLAFGDRLVIRTGATPLMVLGYDRLRRARLFP